MDAKMNELISGVFDNANSVLQMRGMIRQLDIIHIVCEYEFDSIWVQGLFDTSGSNFVWIGVALNEENVYPGENPLIKFGLLKSEKFPTIVYIWDAGERRFTRLGDWIWHLKRLADADRKTVERAFQNDQSEISLKGKRP